MVELMLSAERLAGKVIAAERAESRERFPNPRPLTNGLSAPLTYVNGVTVSVVIPAMNEARNLPHVLPAIPEWVDEVLLVDGHSTDDTVAVARRLRPTIRIIAQQGRGKGAALRSGFAAAMGDVIVMLDADGSMDPAEIPLFISALITGADFAKGSRFLQGGGTFDMSWIRYAGNWGLTGLVRLAFGGNFSDLCYGYNAFWRRILPTLALDADGFEIETLMNVRALRSRLKVAEVPSFEARRIHGTSNLHTLRDGWRVLKTIVRERCAPPITRPARLGAPTYPRPTALLHYETCTHCGSRVRATVPALEQR
jgi:glycosyltransferase involved in cell wall biosynthesis